MRNPTRSSPQLYITIVHWIGEEIRSGRLGAGDQLPTERKLCEQFSVSRTVVREALSLLKSEELISTHQGKGAFVAKRTERHGFRIDHAPCDGETSIKHLLELLMTIEVAATRLAAMRRTSEDVKKMRQALDGMEGAIFEESLGDDAEHQFHKTVLVAAGNPHLKALSEYLGHGIRRMIHDARINMADKYSDDIQLVQDERRAIFLAILAGDPSAAACAASRYLSNVSERLGMAHARKVVQRSGERSTESQHRNKEGADFRGS
ncbi:FadR/GntR family transcriptional regulator [Pseudomonas oryzihabitans]|uniref:FadR/GntR family transcriptional regulator n=1 Tax=Pseudomonas oryzihabitans TaxID=47885 RepID=UPI00123A9A3C|nr:FadR/GntR family transcriptional regulator [Pseudomonas oryzihabitans]QEU01795.1 FadR family transcriptional regulator [Pseudomonas oryzihabitans]